MYLFCVDTPTNTLAALILSIVTDNGNMDADDLDQDMLTVALASGLVVNRHGFIYPATARAA